MNYENSSNKSHKKSEDDRKFLNDNVFGFYGLMKSDGLLDNIGGPFFNDNALDSTVSPQKKFSEYDFWQTDSYSSKSLEDALLQSVNGNVSKIETEFKVNDQKSSFFDMFFLPATDDDGNISDINFYAYDITDIRKEKDFYKEQSERFLYAAESADIGLWFWELAENKISSTPKCNEIFGLGAYDILTLENFYEALHPDDRERVGLQLKHSRENLTDYDTEYRVISPEGHISWIAARGKVYVDAKGLPINMTGIVRDITDRKIADIEMQRLLESEKTARDAAVEANRAKDYFLAIVSHELRTPLNAMLGWTKILLSKELDNETRRNALETIERSAKSQAKLIEDLVDLARIASGKLRLELRRLDLCDLLKTVFNQHKPAAAAKNISLDFYSNVERAEIFGDTVRLQQVFSNILSNALKFTPEGGKVVIETTADAENVSVKISDTGRGISHEFLPNIFQQFAQDETKQSGEKQGLGLGLAIVKTLVEKHDGTITADSKGIGQGSTFTVNFRLHSTTKPVGFDVSPKNFSTDSDEQKLQGVKILLVEDDEDSRDVLTLYLEQYGAEITGAEDAYKAFKLLTEAVEKFDVIISDLGMPGEDGYTFLSRVRNLPADKGGNIPAVALSAFTTAENKEKAFSSGFQKYHTKPFEPDLLVKQINELLGR